MNDSTSPVMAGAPAQDAHRQARRLRGRPSLAFADADGAKRWAKALPLTNVAQFYEAVHGQLRALSAADFAPRERATIAEVLRDQVAYLHTELARRYAGKPQPAVDRELEAADQAIALWQALWEQYSACLKPLLEGDPELAGVKPKLLQRGLYVGKQMVRRLRPRAARAAACAVARAPCVLPAGRDAGMRGDGRVRRADGRTPSEFPATRPTRTRCCSASPIRTR